MNVPECGGVNVGGDVDDGCDGKITPDHHARRPMNAFLIFCKRHRAIVREKYKNLENRSITKILGDWWATLGAEEKSCYTNLAKQYKDAFFSANPNFKWYKLPAPPLRTLNTRPGNVDRSSSAAATINTNYVQGNDNYETIINTSKDLFNNRGNRSSTVISNDGEVHIENPFEHHQNYYQSGREKYSNVGIFKLADETQMGGLNNLIINDKQLLKNSLTKELIKSSSESVVIKVESVDNEKNVLPNNTYFMPQDSFGQFKDANKIENNQGEKRKAIDDGNMNEMKRINYVQSINQMIDDEDKERKSVRACKGKKYQEFLNSGQIIPFIKKLRPKSTSHYSTTSSNYDMVDSSQNPNSKFENSDYFENSTILKSESEMISNSGKIYSANDGSNNNNNNNTTESSLTKVQFNASDFDLEEKIKALPAQNLEKYLQRKRDTKKKKKFSSKRQNNSKNVAKHNKIHNNNNNNSSNSNISLNKTVIIEDNRDNNNIQKTLIVGSQKRKARKESITRRDINAINNEQLQQQQQQQQQEQLQQQQQNTVYETVESLVKLSTIDNNVINNDLTTKQQNTTSATNLHLLNILAEVATNHIRNEKT